MSSVNDLLLASEGIEETVDQPDTVKAFLYAMMSGYVASEGFERKLLITLAKCIMFLQRTEIAFIWKAAYGKKFYGGYLYACSR